MALKIKSKIHKQSSISPIKMTLYELILTKQIFPEHSNGNPAFTNNDHKEQLLLGIYRDTRDGTELPDHIAQVRNTQLNLVHHGVKQQALSVTSMSIKNYDETIAKITKKFEGSGGSGIPESDMYRTIEFHTDKINDLMYYLNG